MTRTRFFAIVLFILFFTSCTEQHTNQYANETNDASLAKIIVKNELSVGVDPSIPPLSFYSSTGKLVGYEVDIAQKIADRLGVKLKLVPVTGENRIEHLESRAIDYIASGFLNTPESAEQFSLTIPYLRDALVVVVSESVAGGTPFKHFSDLRNKRIGILSDDAIVSIVNKSPLYRDNARAPYLYPRLEKLLIALDYGQLEAVVMNLLTYYSKITKEKKPYRVIDNPLIIGTYSYALRKEDRQLTGVLNALLTDMSEEAELKAIAVKWFGADVSIVGKY